jgi:cellulose synthase/poly-beta-1,6-N-acetylglucosamine synthase-like glycosyltransferase
MFLKFNLFDLFYLSFIQLVLSTVLVLSPARAIGTRFRWTGSRITEVFVGGVGAAAISALAVVGTHELWGMAIGGLETAAYLLVVVSVVVMVLQPGTNFIGQVFFASFLSAFATSIVYAAFIAIVATHSIAEILTASLVILLDLAALVVWISNINYTSDVLCRARRGRPLPQADPSYQPFVSLHVPAYNEPPELLIETIKAVERIDYPNFEVIVIDNNTADPAVWGPVEEYCRDRSRVKFVHVAPWPGYKAGACNLALRRYTDPRAEIIGLVDADDIVQPYYLREVAPYFSDPDLGFIQTFEGNREFQGSAYYTACVDSFQAFYLSVMSSRNERDSIPFVGTMGLFRRSALTAVGGWNEWCICEDTEASLRVARDGWSGLYIPRCFGRGVVPPSFAGMLTQRHRWCFGGMQIMRLHWRSLMPWDRSVGNHLTSAQRRDYLMASIGWFRDLLMLAFSLLLIAVSGLLVTDSGYAISPMDGARSQLPMSLIVIATICMLWTLRLWTTMSFRRALLSLVISLSVTWVVALGCIEGMIRKDAVFLRTSKVAGRRRIGPALRLTRFETILAAILYTGVGLLAASRHRPWLLMSIIFLQACVYLCGPIASAWNLWAQGVTSGEYRRRFEQRRLRAQRRRWSWGQLHRPVAGAIAALAVGGVASAFLAPVPLLQATAAVHRNASAQSLLGGTTSTEVYLKLGSSTSGTGRKYYPITAVHLLTTAGHTGLKFSTSSLALLGEVLQASAAGGKIPAVTLAFRAPGLKGQLTTEAVDTFGATTVTAVKEHLSPMPAAGSVSLTLPAQSHVLAAPAALQRVGPFGPPTTAAATEAFVTMGAHGSSASYAVSAVQLAQTASGAPLDLKFSTSSVPLLDTIFHDEGTGATINDLTLTIRAGGGGQPFDKALTYTFAQLSVGAFAENLSGSLSGTAALVVHPR